MKNTFLFAAGFSYQFGMPLAPELTDIFYALFEKESLEKFIDEIVKTSPYGDDRPINKDAIQRAFNVVLKHKDAKNKNYEAVISEIEKLPFSCGFNNTSDQDSYHIVHNILYGFIHTILVKYQEMAYPLYSLNKEPYENFKSLLSQDTETWVFTLNHDLFFECLSIDFGIPLTFGNENSISFRKNNRDGFNTLINFSSSNIEDININNPNYFKNQYGVNLVKLHGGLNELTYKDKKQFCNLSLDVKNSEELIQNFKNMMQMSYIFPNKETPSSSKEWLITNMDNEFDIASKSMLTGGNKYSSTLSKKEGEQKLSLFTDIIEDSDLLTVVGYSFGDKHINHRIVQALHRNKNLKIKLVSPNQQIPECLEAFDENNRIKRVSADVANWLYYEKYQTWSNELVQCKYLEKTDLMRKLLHQTFLELFSIKKAI